MGDGNKIIIFINTQLPFAPNEEDSYKRSDRDDNPRHHHPRENGSNLYNRQWQKNSAADLRNNLLSMLSEKEIPNHRTGNHQDNSPFSRNPVAHNNETTNQNSPQNTANQNIDETETQNIFNRSSNNTNTQTASNRTSGETDPQSFLNQTLNDDVPQNVFNRTGNSSVSQNPVSQTINDLINFAKEHKDFANFRNQPESFWNDVRQMSDIRIVEKYVDGKLEPRVFSRYGEILEKFTRQGGQLTTFLNSLPPQEREVFQARYLLNQTLGADELYIGKGIVIDKNGQFMLREFLENNGKKLETPLNTVLGLFGGNLSETSTASLFTNGQLLLNAKTAALLSLSITLYQNANSLLPLTEAFSEINPQNLLGRTNENGGMRFVENNLDNSKVNAERRNRESMIAAALINGAMVVLDEREESANVKGDARKGGETILGNMFSAGASGSMLGAVIGCVVPLAESNVGTALGFAASIVVGTSERGLRYLSANLLISDVITTGVQTFLSISSSKLQMAEKPDSSDLLKQQLFANRTFAYLTS